MSHHLIDRKNVLAHTLVTVFVVLASCGGGMDDIPLVKQPTASDAPVGLHQCKVRSDTARPMLVEWPATEKAALQSSSQRGVVVVSYDGCRLRMLDTCAVEGEYEFQETSRSKDGFAIKDKSELFAKLPLGAISLEGELAKGRSLNLSYVAVGTRTARLSEVKADQLKGACTGATHFVRTLIVGAYELASEASLDVGAAVEVGPAGVGGGHSGSTRIIRSDGDLAMCAERSTPADVPACAAVVQLVLVPITPHATPPPAPVVVVARPSAPEPEPASAPIAPAPAPAPVEEKEPVLKGGSGSFEMIYHEAYCAGNVQIIPFTDVDPMAKKMLKMVRGKSYCSTKGPFIRRFEDHSAATRWVDKQTWGDEEDDF